MRLVDRFDRWVERGPFTSTDLGIYRIIYALSALMIAPRITWLSDYPDFMFRPPTGPLQLLSGIPSPGALHGLEVVRSAVFVMLALGLWTRFSSMAAAVMLTVTYGLVYSLGKVDHTILIVLAPLVLAFADWGNRFSIDALRHGRRASPQVQWPLRLLALLIAWGFFAAALTKLLTGWLSYSSQAARGYFVLGYLTEDRTSWLARWVATHDIRPAWELVDWLTVIFELSILAALPWWRCFRSALAIASGFHLAVLVTMNISFSTAVVAYGAFVSWGTVASRIGESRPFRTAATFLLRRRAPRSSAATNAAVIAAAAIGVALWTLAAHFESQYYGNAVIALGAVIGLWYLIVEARRMLS